MDIDMSFPVFLGNLEKVLRFADSRIVHDHIKFTESSRRVMNSSLCLLAVTDINGFDEGASAQCFDLFSCRLDPLAIEVEEGDVSTFTGKAEGNGFANPSASAGY